MRRARILWLALLLIVLLRPELGAGCDIPLEATKTSFTAEVRIDGSKPLRFLVDTGSSLTVIDREVAESLQIRAVDSIEALSTTGALRMNRAVVPSIRAGSIERSDIDVLITPLPIFRSHGHLDGILGMNFFKGGSVLLDSRRRCLDVDAPALEGARIEAQEVVGRVAAKIGGLNFVIDSGASFIVLLSDAAKSLASRDAHAAVTTASGSESAEAGTIRALQIGARTIRDVPAVFGRSTGDPREDGLLPITLFHAIFIDASRSVVVLK